MCSSNDKITVCQFNSVCFFTRCLQRLRLPARNTVVDIKYHGYDKQMVSVEGYINVNECYQSAYSQFSSKKEVYFNDDTNAIVLTLWDDCINLVPRSGTYKLSNVIVRCLESYKDEPVIISTVSSTVIEISVVNIKQMMPAFTINRIKKFPILDFNISARNKKCPKCKTNAAAESLTDFFKCISCSSFSRYSKLETMRTVKVTFEEDKEKEVTIFGMQLQDYCAHFGISVNDEDAITESFFLVASTRNCTLAKTTTHILFVNQSLTL